MYIKVFFFLHWQSNNILYGGAEGGTLERWQMRIAELKDITNEMIKNVRFKLFNYGYYSY